MMPALPITPCAPSFRSQASNWKTFAPMMPALPITPWSQASNWKTFAPMMRDDFTLFDEYVYTPLPSHLPNGEFPFPIQAKYLVDDKRCKKEHLEMWKAFTSEKLSFTCEQYAGNHLFFYDVPARAKWMEGVIAKLPAGFS